MVGQVVRVADADTVPEPNLQVVLHRVALDGGAPVDSVFTNRNGSYRFPGVQFDSLALIVVSSEYGGIAYFTSPLSIAGDAVAEQLIVYDTSSVSLAITVAQRHVIVSPTEDGENIGVLELVVLENTASVTRVSSDSITPVWVGHIPAEAGQFQIGESEISGEAITLVGTAVGIIAPIPPGRRQIVYSYLLPRGIESVDYDLDQSVGDMNVLIDVRSSGRMSGDLDALGEQEIGAERYLHYEGANLAAGMSLELVFPGPPMETKDFIPWLVALGALLMLGAAFIAWRKGPAPVVVQAAPPVEEGLAARIAALDQQFESLESPTPEQEDSYRKQRAEMKEILIRTLAKADQDN